MSSITLDSGYKWVNASIVPSVSTEGNKYAAIYNDDPKNYNDKEVSVIIKVKGKKTLTAAEIPNSKIPAVYDPNKKVAEYLNELAAGFSFADTVTDADKNTVLNARTEAYEYAVIYNPDSTNYENYETKISITISKADMDAADLKKTIDGGTYVPGKTLEDGTYVPGRTLDDIKALLPAGYTWDDPTLEVSRNNTDKGVHPTFTATWNADSSDPNYNPNYNKCTGVEITITLAKVTVTIDSIEKEFSKNIVSFDLSASISSDIADGIIKVIYAKGTDDEYTLMAKDYTKLKYSDNSVTFGQGGTYLVGVEFESNNFKLDNSTLRHEYITETDINEDNAKLDATEVIVKIKSVLYDGTLYTIEDALAAANKANSGTVIVAYNTIMNVNKITNSDPTYSMVSASDDSFKEGFTKYYRKGVTLLVPYSEDHSTEKRERTFNGDNNNGNPYSTLTLAAGKNLKIYGTLNVAGLQYGSSSQHTGNTWGDYGMVVLEGDSSIIIDGNYRGDEKQASFLSSTEIINGELDCFGYIIGTGSVQLTNASVAYEPIAFKDYPGGSASYAARDSFFPVNQFHIANIEASLTINLGTTLYVSYAAYASGVGKIKDDIAFISSTDGLFILDSSSNDSSSNDSSSNSNEESKVVKKVNSDGSICIEVYGKIKTGNITVNVSLASCSTDGKELPICGYYDLIVKEQAEVTISSKLKLLPGAKLTIEKGAECTITSDGAIIAYDKEYKDIFYIYDSDNKRVSTVRTYGGDLTYKYTRLYWNKRVVYTSDSKTLFKVRGTLIVNGKLGGNIVTDTRGFADNETKPSIQIDSSATVSGTIMELCIYKGSGVSAKIISVSGYTTTYTYTAKSGGTTLEHGKTYIGNGSTFTAS